MTDTIWQVTRWDEKVNGGTVVLEGEFPTEEEAVARRDELRAQGITAQVNEWPEHQNR